MEKITVNKEKLLTTLQTNRSEHRAMFEKAQEVYRAEVIKVLDKRLKQARKGGRIVTFINLPEPVDYTTEFDRAIAMVEWNEGNEVTLSERDFQRYVLNMWEWQQNFAASTMRYV